MVAVIVAMAGVSYFLISYYIIYNCVINDRLEERVRFYSGAKGKRKVSGRGRRKGLADFKSMSAYKGLTKVVKSMKIGKKYSAYAQKEAIRAGLLLRGEEVLVFQIILAVAIGGIIYLATDIRMLSVAGVAAGFFTPVIVIKHMKRKRYKAFNDQLGDAVSLISNSLKVGHSFLQSIDSVVNEMPDPMAAEFRKLMKEMRLGVQTEEALHNLLDRVQSRDLELLVTAISIQRQTGGNLSGILDQITSTIRDRVKISGEVRTLTSQGRLSGIIVSLLPVVLGVAIFFIDRDYIMLLFSTTIGHVMMGAAVISEVFGFIVIQKIVNIEL